MNRILSLLVLLAFSTMAQAQSPYLPYNPDENADGLIGVADLQGLLSLYGSEFSGAIHSDNGNIAVVPSGNMTYLECMSSCRELPGNWRIVKPEEAGLIFDQLTGSGDDGHAWLFNTDNTRIGYAFNNGGLYHLAPGEGYTTANTWECFCATKQRPRVEYSYCSGNQPNGETFNQCISEKLAQGWYPLSGFPNHHDRQATGGQGFQHQTHASFWRWEQ